MTPPSDDRIKELFLKACDLPPQQRRDFIDRECGGDPELREEVESLLAHDGESIGMGEQEHETETERIPVDLSDQQTTRIGSYKVLRALGEGGMGVVYLAEQNQPIPRQAALKVIKWGMDTKEVVARFEAERQALAMMDHPCVAKVYEAGVSAKGRPYFAMEYVQGVPITEHCDRHKLTTRERLELFQQVCHGVQHAHQKAIIHRDLKPSNVLVSVQDDAVIPKIIDFGVAKALSRKLTERTLVTELGQLVGTPEYMSPEQAEMTRQNVDTRTDVYSLGVLLYELLVGALPFDSRELRQAGVEGILHTIREEEPPKPSTRVSTLGERSAESARQRRVDVSTLQRQLRGDLDWITMRALEKDRTRRYGSPQELAADIERHLSDQPVLAGPPGAAYRARKFVRRHRLGVAAAAILVLSVAVGVIGATVGLLRAQREADRSERVAQFLANMLGNVEPESLGTTLWRDLREQIEEIQDARGTPAEQIEQLLASFETAADGVNPTNAALRLIDEEVMARAAEMIESDLTEEPRIAARLRYTIGRTYKELGLFEQAEANVRAAMVLREELLGPNHPETLDSKYKLGEIYLATGDLAEAEPYVRAAMEGRRRVLGDDHRDTLDAINHMAVLCNMQGKRDESYSLFSEAVERSRRALGADHPATLFYMGNFGGFLIGSGKLDEAELHLSASLEGQRRVRGSDHRDTLISILNVGGLLERREKWREAEQHYREAVAGHRRVLGDDHIRTLVSIQRLGSFLLKRGRLGEAEPYLREALERLRRTRGEQDVYTAWATYDMGRLLHAQDELDEAEQYYRAALERCRSVFGLDHSVTLSVLYDSARLAAVQGRADEAVGLLREAVDLGWADQSILDDAEFASLRRDPAFENIVAEVQTRIEEGR